MSQYNFGTIDPNTKSGTALATDLNSWRTALHTTHSGSTAPSYITAGMLWLDTTTSDYILKMYDGAQSIPIARIDATNNVVRAPIDNDLDSYLAAVTNNEISAWISGTKTFTMKAGGLRMDTSFPTIQDMNGNTALQFQEVASAVNYHRLTNAATGNSVSQSAAGSDTNIGLGLFAKGDQSTIVGTLTAATTNTVHEALKIRHDTTGSPANGIGTAVLFEVETTGGRQNAMRISAIATDVTSGSEDFDMLVELKAAGTQYVDAFRVTADGYFRLENLVGLQFHGDTAAANALNDYEEGTFTPTIVGSTTAGTGTYTTQVGRYTKIGRMVTVSVAVTWTAHTGTGNLRIGGLPFASANVGVETPLPLQYQNLTVPASAIAFGAVPANSSQIVIRSITGGAANFAELALDTAATIWATVTYEAA